VTTGSEDDDAQIKRRDQVQGEEEEEEEDAGAGNSRKKFRSYVEAELWFGGVQDMYDLNVEKIIIMLDVGASDGDIRAAMSDLNGIVSDARKHHPDRLVRDKIDGASARPRQILQCVLHHLRWSLGAWRW
jgi:hypothetical protein